MNGAGGIATVMKEYRKVIKPFRSGSVNSCHGKLPGLLNLAWTLCKIAGYRTMGSKILHIHYAGQKSWKRENMLAAIGRKLGYKTLMHCHCDLVLLDKHQGRSEIISKLSQADAHIVLANSYRDFAEKEIGLKNVSVIPNFTSAPGKTPETKLNNPPVFLFLGLLNRDKGFFDLLEACSRLVKDGLDFRLVVGGIGNMPEIESFIAENHLADKVELRGWISGTDKEQALRSADVLVLPSYTEGMPMVIIEAMLAGCAVIGTGVGAIPDMIGNSHAGTVVTPGDIDMLTQSMAAFIKDHNTLEQARTEALTVGQRYTPFSVLPQLENLYNNLLEQK
ncbi:MAG: glycosyltransferase family 4 protein [Muribaculaceae bacterium]|nr:glycosyltransferase family 4 protein [Muribaculaceae bacterium]